MNRPDPPDFMFKAVTSAHIALFRATDGAVGGRMLKMPVLLLTTTGRKSGQKRTTPLTYFTEGEDIILVASKGGHPKNPAWYLNLTANPEVEVEEKGRKRMMKARTATDDEKARFWPRITSVSKGYAGYQERTERPIPLVILTNA